MVIHSVGFPTVFTVGMLKPQATIASRTGVVRGVMVQRLPLFTSLTVTAVISIVTVQPAWAKVNQVTAVSVESTTDGIEVILQTISPHLSQIITSTYENTYIAEITNAQLRLESGEPFNVSNPTNGIANVSVTSLDENSVRVVVAGIDSPPFVKVDQSHENLVLTVAAPTTPTATEEDWQLNLSQYLCYLRTFFAKNSTI